MIYPTLGNHDCYSDMYNEVRLAKYDYQWRLEEDYYVKINPLPDRRGKYFVNLMLNSCKTVCPDNEFTYKNECNIMGLEPGDASVKAHYDWIVAQLERYTHDPDAAWIAITLHHQPFIYPGQKSVLLPLLKKYKVEIIITGHEHWLDYSNMDYNYNIRYPTEEYGPVIVNCTDSEVFKTETREVDYYLGEKLHQFVVGSAGAIWWKSACPILDTDGDMLYRSTSLPGIMTMEVTYELLTATYIYSDGTVGYIVRVHRSRNTQ